MTLKSPHNINIAIGKNLRAIRNLKGLSQRELGETTSPPITFQQIQKYEKGVNRISIPVLLAMAEGLRCELADLVEGVYTGEEMAHHITEEYDMAVVREFHSIKNPQIQKNIKTLINSLARL